MENNNHSYQGPLRKSNPPTFFSRRISKVVLSICFMILLLLMTGNSLKRIRKSSQHYSKLNNNNTDNMHEELNSIPKNSTEKGMNSTLEKSLEKNNVDANLTEEYIYVDELNVDNIQLLCDRNKCKNCQKIYSGIPNIPSVTIYRNNIMAKSSTYFNDNWGNVLSPYWAARAMAKIGGYAYLGKTFGHGTWMEFLPTTSTALRPRKQIFDEICVNCESYEFFHKGSCSAGWGVIAPEILKDTRSAILQEYNRTGDQYNWDFFGPNDWLIYNRCVVLNHVSQAPGVLRTYDVIPTEGQFNVFIMDGRKEDEHNLCNVLISESMEYITTRNNNANATLLPKSTQFIDFSRLVFAPNVLIASVGSSWALYSAILANNNNVISHLPAFDADVSMLPKSVQFLTDIPTLRSPSGSVEVAAMLGIPVGQFNKEAVLRYFRSENKELNATLP